MRRCELYNAKRTKSCKNFYHKWYDLKEDEDTSEGNCDKDEDLIQRYISDMTLYA